MNKVIVKGFALVDAAGNLHSLCDEMNEEIAETQREAFFVDLGLVVEAFAVEACKDVWSSAKLMAGTDRKVEAWQTILTEGRVL